MMRRQKKTRAQEIRKSFQWLSTAIRLSAGIMQAGFTQEFGKKGFFWNLSALKNVQIMIQREKNFSTLKSKQNCNKNKLLDLKNQIYYCLESYNDFIRAWNGSVRKCFDYESTGPEFKSFDALSPLYCGQNIFKLY